MSAEWDDRYERLRWVQSLLFVPGDRPDRFGKALSAGADAVICDLEDAVRPGDRPAARRHVADLLGRPEPRSTPVLVRVNGVGTGELRADLRAVLGGGAGARLAGLVVPKLDPEAAAEADRMVEQVEREHRMSAGSIPVLGIVETATGLIRLAALPELPQRVVRLGFGAGDFAADTGASWQPGNPALAAAGSMLVWISTALGLPGPVDTAFPWPNDPDGLAAEARTAAAAGYTGKFCIHPGQLPAVHAAFRPAPEQVRWARAVLSALSGSGAGAQLLDGQLIDEAVVKQARRVIAAADHTAGDSG